MNKEMAMKYGRLTAIWGLINFVVMLFAQVSYQQGWKTVTADSHHNKPGELSGTTEASTSSLRRLTIRPIGRSDGIRYQVGADMPTLHEFQSRKRNSARLDRISPDQWEKYARRSHKQNKEFCDYLPGLVPRQRKICMEIPELVAAAVDGAGIAIKECKRQFQYERWNCSLLMTQVHANESKRHRKRTNANLRHSSGEVLSKGLRNATREAAFVHAIMSAGIAHAVTASCRRGDLSVCHCDKNASKLNVAMKILGKIIAWEEENTSGEEKVIALATLDAIRKRELYGASNTILENRTWTLSRNAKGQIALVDDLKQISWGGCSDDVRFGVRFSRKFLEAPYKDINRKKRSVRDDVKLHNGEVGRRIVQDLTRVHCRCHGVSGACTAQTCWMQMPSFEEVGDALKKKYMQGTVRAQAEKKRRRLRHVTVNSYDIDSGRLRKVPKTQLAFINDTPNLCFRNQALGILGTAERKCLKNSDDRGDCRHLCCGRGYNVMQVNRKWRCECKFIYCCEVQCRICDETKNAFICKA